METAEIVRLDAQVANAHEWLAKVKESQDVDYPLRELERLVRSGKSLPVKFGEPYDTASKRLAMSLDLQKRIQATFKSCKTRGAVQAPSDALNSAGPKAARGGAKSNHGMY